MNKMIERVFRLNDYPIEKQNSILRKFMLESGFEEKFLDEEKSPKTFEGETLKIEWEIKNIGTSDPTITITCTDSGTNKISLAF